MRADQTEQFPERYDRRFFACAVRFGAGFMHVGRPAQRDRVVGVEWNQQHAERAGALRLGLAMEIERVEGEVAALGGLRSARRDIACSSWRAF